MPHPKGPTEITKKKIQFAKELREKFPTKNGREIYDLLRKKFGSGLDYGVFYATIRAAPVKNGNGGLKTAPQLTNGGSPDLLVNNLSPSMAQRIKDIMVELKDGYGVYKFAGELLPDGAVKVAGDRAASHFEGTLQ